MDKPSHEELITLKRGSLSKSVERLGCDASEILLYCYEFEGNIESWSQELDSKEKELQTLSTDLNKKVETFEKEKSEANNLKKLMEECAEELRLTRNELTGKLDTSTRIQREIEVKKNLLQQHSAEIKRLCRETNKKKNELALTLEQVEESEKQVKMKSLELGSKEQDLGLVRESIELSNAVLEVKRKMVQLLNNEIDSKSKESRKIQKLIEELTSEFVVMQNQHDSIRSSSSEMEERAKEVKDKEKELKNQIELEEKKLVELKREMEEVSDIKKKDLELTLSKIEESGEQLAAVSEKLESRRRQLEVKEKRFQELNNLIKISGEQLGLKCKELREVERELKLKKRLRQMSTVLVKQPFIDNIDTEQIDTFMLYELSSQAKEKDGGRRLRLRAILEHLADYKVEIDLPGDYLIATVMVEGESHLSVESVASSSDPQAGLKKKTVLVKQTGVEDKNLGTTLPVDVDFINETSDSKRPPHISEERELKKRLHST